MYQVVPGVRLVLASASPRRREMLGRLGLEFSLSPAETDETIQDGEKVEEAALRLAALKAKAVSPQRPGAVILAADTLVSRGREILGKPAGLQQARAMLKALSGAEHQVVTGYCLLQDGRQFSGLAVTRVRFRSLSSREIEAYLATGEPMGKAGAYAIQGRGAALVEEVDGSYTNVVGLPLAALIDLMLARRVIQPVGEERA